MAYIRKVWTNNSTPLNADNLNNIENGIEENQKEIKNIKTSFENDNFRLANKVGLKLNSSKTGYEINNAIGTEIYDLINLINTDETYMGSIDVSEENLKHSILYLLIKEAMQRFETDSTFIQNLQALSYILGASDVAIPDESNPIMNSSDWIGKQDRTYTDVINTLMVTLMGGAEIPLVGGGSTTITGSIQDKINEKFSTFETPYTGNNITTETIDTYGKVLAYINKHKTEFNEVQNKFKNYLLIKDAETIIEKIEGDVNTEGSILNLIASEHKKIGQGTIDPVSNPTSEELQGCEIYYRYLE